MSASLPRPRSTTRQISILGAATTAAAVLFWYGARLLLTGAFSSGSWASALGTLLGTLVAFSVMLGLLGLTGMVSDRALVRWIVAVPVSIPPLLFFPLGITAAIAVLLLLLAVRYYLWTSAKESRSRIRFSFDKTLVVDLRVTIVAILVVLSVSYFGLVVRAGRGADQVLENISTSTTTLADRILPLVLDQYDPQQSVDDFIRQQLPDANQVVEDLDLERYQSRALKQSVLEDKLRELGIDPTSVNVNAYIDQGDQAQADLQQLIDEQLVAFQGEAVAATRDEFSRNFGVELTGQETLAVALSSIVSQNVDRVVRPYADLVPAILALSLFFLLSLTVFLDELIVRGVGQLLYHSLKAGGAIRVVTSDVKAEHLALGSGS